MKKTLIIILTVFSFLFVTNKVQAEWQRLKMVDRLDMGFGKVQVVYDEVEQVNCYLYRDTWGLEWGSVAISCLPIKNR